MSAPKTPSLGVNNILSFNGHGGKDSGKSFTLDPNSNVYILVPFGLGVELPTGSKPSKTDESHKGLDVCYTFPAPTATNLTFEEIIYGNPGKIKFTFGSNVDAKWYLYKPGEIVPNVEYYSWNPAGGDPAGGDPAGGGAEDCDKVLSDYDHFVSDLMKDCMGSSSDLRKKVCAYFVSDTLQKDPLKPKGNQSQVFIDSKGYRHLKLKICSSSIKGQPTTTLKDLAENCRELVNVSREYVTKNNKPKETYDGYNDDNIFPKSKSSDPIILLPFICNACTGVKNTQLEHSYGSDGSDASLKPLSDIIADLSRGGGGSASPPSSTPNCSIDASNKYITNITPKCQQDIFGLVPSTSSEQDILKKHLSVLRTDTQNATNHNLPPGSATIVDLNYYRENSEYPKNTQKLGIDIKNSTEVNSFNNEILFVIQAAPGGFRATNASKESLKNCVYNSLYLANAKGIKGIAFPLIGAGIFGSSLITNKVVTDKNELYNLLLEGVTDYFNYFTDSIIEIILFADYKPTKTDNDNFEKIFTEFKRSFKAELIRKEDDIFIATDKYNKEESKLVKINALVNAANTEITFNGVDGLALAFKNRLGGELKDKESGLNENIFTIPDVITKQGTEIKKEFKAAVDAYIARPSAASSPPPKPEPPKKPFDGVLTTLQGQLDKNGDPSVVLTTLGVAKVKDDQFLYPTDGDEANKKSLNSAGPTIDVMIKGFESAETGDDTNFYLGACRSIQAAYQLERGDKTDDTSAEAMRAKLLLNLRKNSLLLKVQARWDYAEMKMKKLPPPPTDLNELMNYSLQDTIEYYSQDGGDEGTRFKELNIAKEPEMNWAFDTKRMGPKGKSGNAAGVDKRFTKGFDNVLGVSCYFSTFLQLLLCDEDFLQLLIISICKPIEYDVSEKFIIMKNLVDIFKHWFPIKNDNIQTITSNIKDNVTTILRELGMDTSKENDAREVYVVFIANIININDNVYIKKFVNNLEYNDNIVQNYEGIEKTSVPKNETGYMLLIKPEISESTTSESTKKINTSIQKLITENEKEKVDTNFTLSIDDFLPNSSEYKLYKLYNNITKTGIVSIIRNICNVKYDDKNKENSTKLTHLKTLNSFITLGEDGVTDNTDYSYKNITKLLKNPDYKDIINDINSIVDLVDTKFNNDKKNIDFTLVDITDKICTSANKIYELINSKLDTLSKPTKSQIKKTKNTINKTHEYIVLDINRTMSTGKNFMNVTINTEVTICNKKYILRGYSFHIGDTINGGHYEFVKCDSLGNPALVLNDYGIMNLNDIATTTGGGSVVVTSEELRQTGVSSLIYKKADSQAGGGFKPRRNTITNHAKSKHNSSFKASSSSKSKGKSHSRSHTQRVK
jgi:hypothetical protein